MTDSSQRLLTSKLVLLAVAMFGFGFALVPLYDVFCDLTGFGGKIDGPAAALAQRVDLEREVRIEFVASRDRSAPWNFEPHVASMIVHPGQIYETYFTAENLRPREMTAHAVPSIAPGTAAEYLRKIECFCFTEQHFEPQEARDMPVVFMIDTALPDYIDTVTLAYTFFAAADSGDGQH
jgi:cytochrome c oxidase assembly protein subunit 11